MYECMFAHVCMDMSISRKAYTYIKVARKCGSK